MATVSAYNSGTRLNIGLNNTLPFFNPGRNPNIGPGNARSDVSLGAFDPGRDLYLNRAAFLVPVDGQYGNAPRYLETRGPGRLEESFAVMKNTRITERLTHQFRLEMQNPFNRVVFANPVTNLAANNFGTIASTQIDPRNIQFGMKFIW